MKHLIIGDLHGRKSNLDVIDKVLEKSRMVASKCDATIFMGDVNHSKSTIRSEVQRLLINYFIHWPTNIYIIVGNHDWDNSIECSHHSLEALNFLKNVKVIERLTKIDNMIFVPYLPEERFLQLELPNADYLFTHQDIEGFNYSSNEPVKSNIKSSIFRNYKKVFNGHIHLAQEKQNIICVGTPYTTSFKESDEHKQVLIHDTEKNSIEIIPLNVRQHVTYPYTIKEFGEIKDIKADLKKKIEDYQIVRLHITAPEEICSKIKKPLFKGFEIAKLKITPISTTEKIASINEEIANRDAMITYLKQLDLTESVLDETTKLHNSIFDEIEGIDEIK